MPTTYFLHFLQHSSLSCSLSLLCLVGTSSSSWAQTRSQTQTLHLSNSSSHLTPLKHPTAADLLSNSNDPEQGLSATPPLVETQTLISEETSAKKILSSAHTFERMFEKYRQALHWPPCPPTLGSSEVQNLSVHNPAGHSKKGDFSPVGHTRKGGECSTLNTFQTTSKQSWEDPSTKVAQRITPVVPPSEGKPSTIPPSGDLLKPPEIPDESPSESIEVPDTIIVEKFNIVGSTIFSKAEFAAVMAPFTRRPITFTELIEARSAITKLYVDKGYKTSGAYIPPGPISDGVVTIKVVEGRLEAIQVTGNKRLRADYISDRIALATKPPLNINKLLEALQLLQLNPRIKTLSAELSAGVRPGTSLLQVNMTEAKTFRPRILLNNERFSSVGSFQRVLELRELNMTGNGDTIGLAYANTDGLNEIDFGYTFPITARNNTVGIRFNQIWSRVIEEPFDVLDLLGDSRVIDLTYRQPVIQSSRQELALGLTASRRESSTSLLGEPFPLSPGADEEGRTRLSILRFFQEWTRRGRKTVFALRSEFSFGLPIAATENPLPPDGEFFIWRGQAQWVRQLAPDTLVLLRSNVQLADRPIVPFEQFGIGGLNSARGYRQNLFLVDNGVFISAEGRVPILRIYNGEGVLQIAPFIDFGNGWNNDDGRFFEDSNRVLSAGLGLRWQWSDRLSARVDFGIPLISVGDEASGFDDQQIFFSIVATPF